jgi:hypothetical protein
VTRIVATFALLVVFSTAFATSAAFQADTLPAELTDQEFWRLVTEFAEPSGDYPYQNFVSNEITIQRIIPPTKRTIKPGGVFIGVGPEQNFTYASALQSKMAFVVDIRRQNMLVHLMYKALFEMSANRAEFMMNLFSRRRPGFVDERTNVAQTFDLFLRMPPDPVLQTSTAATIKATLAKRGFNLPQTDLAKIDYIHEVFSKGGPNIAYDFMSDAPATSIPYPTYLVMMNSTDATGQNWSFLATESNYQFVRGMQRRNMIVPLVGDFAGSKTLRSIGEYLRRHNTNVSAFYISNVELYLSPQAAPDVLRNSRGITPRLFEHSDAICESRQQCADVMVDTKHDASIGGFANQRSCRSGESGNAARVSGHPGAIERSCND